MNSLRGFTTEQLIDMIKAVAVPWKVQVVRRAPKPLFNSRSKEVRYDVLLDFCQTQDDKTAEGTLTMYHSVTNRHKDEKNALIEILEDISKNPLEKVFNDAMDHIFNGPEEFTPEPFESLGGRHKARKLKSGKLKITSL